MRALDRKLLRDLRRIWAQALAIALVLGCGIMVLVMTAGTLRSLQDTQAAYYDRHRFADIFAGAVRAPASLLDEIAAIDGVAQVEGRIVMSAVLDLPGMVEPATARVLSLPEGREPRLNLPLLRAGRMPDPLRADEVVLSETFALASGLGPGATLRVTLNGQRRDLTVTGHVLSPEFIYAVGPGTLMPDDRHFGLIWMNESALAAANRMQGAFNDLSIGLARGADSAAVIAAVDRLLAPYGGGGATGRDRQISHAFLSSEMQQLSAMAAVLPPVFLIVSALLVNMVLGRLIRLERTQIGLLKAVGYGTGVIAAHYLKLALCIGAGGIVLGWAWGWALGQQMTELYTDYFRFPWLLYRPGTGAVLLSGLLGVVTVVLGALRAVLASVRLAPAVAMAPPAPPAFRRGWLDRVGAALRLRQTTMMILRSITRWPGRAAVTVLGVAASVAVLVASFFTLDASRLMMDELFTQTNRQDATLTLSAARPASAVDEALRLPGVRRAESAFSVPVRLSNGPRTELVAVEARGDRAQLTRLADNRGQPVAIPPTGLVLPERLAIKLDVTVGDPVRMELLAPPRDTVMVRVSAVVRQTLGEGGWMAEDALFALMRTEPQVTRIDLLVDPAQIPALHAAVKDTPAVAGIMLLTDLRLSFEELFNQSLLTLTIIFTAVGALITVGVVYNAARIQLSERAHELASLRVLGFTRGEVGYVLVGEIMLLSLIAVPLGWVLGYGFARGIVSGVSTDIVTMPFSISRRTWALAAVAALSAALGSALLVRRRLDRVDLVMALKQKE